MAHILTLNRKAVGFASGILRLFHYLIHLQKGVNSYENLVGGILDREEYIRLKESFSSRASEAEKQMDALRDTLTNIREHGTENAWMEEFKRHRGITALDRSIVVSLIEKILVHEDDTIEIIYRWQDEFAWQLDVLRRAQIREAV